MIQPCTWPNGTCQHWIDKQSKPDPWGRVWMHCEEGLSMSNASLARFMTFCLKNRVEIGEVWSLNPKYPRALVIATVRIKPNLFEAFERETGGRLKEPPKVTLNSGW